MTFSGFEDDTRTQDAVIRSIEIIGEAENKTRAADLDFAARHTHIPWELMYGIRNCIVPRSQFTQMSFPLADRLVVSLQQCIP